MSSENGTAATLRPALGPRLPANRAAARALIEARRTVGPGRGRARSPLAASSPALRAIIRYRLALVAVIAMLAGAAILLASWLGGERTVLIDQLEVFAGALVGLYMIGVATLAFWAHERQRELVRLADVERYVGAVVRRLGLAVQADGPDRGAAR